MVSSFFNQGYQYQINNAFWMTNYKDLLMREKNKLFNL